MNYLQRMIERQQHLHALIDDKPGIAWGKGTPMVTLFDEIDGVIEEAVELKRVFPQHKKWYPNYGESPTDEQWDAGREEAIDLLHFALNCCIRLGLDTSDKLYAAFAAKNDINFKRQGATYDGERA